MQIHVPEIIGGIVLLVYITYTIREVSKESLWKTSDDEKTSKERSSKRGLLASTVSSGIMVTIISLLTKFTKLDPITTQAMISLLWGNTVGFLLDNFFATEESLQNIEKNGVLDTFKKSIENLSTRKFSRYLLIDTIVISISISLLPHIAQMLTKIFKSELVKNFSMTIAQSIITSMLFLSFTNSARFEWAYADYSISDPRNIMFAIVSLVVSVQMVNKSVKDNKPGIESFEASMILLLFTVLLCVRELSTVEFTQKWLGIFLFMCITVVSFGTSLNDKFLGGVIGITIALIISAIYNEEIVFHSTIGLILLTSYYLKFRTKVQKY